MVPTAYADALAFVGLTHVATGGNCTALELVHNDECHTLITRTQSAVAPTSLSDPVTVGFYDIDADPTFTEFPTLRDAIADLYGQIEA
jgi:hypothetical protein